MQLFPQKIELRRYKLKILYITCTMQKRGNRKFKNVHYMHNAKNNNKTETFFSKN